jgi:hypothetical protein
MQSKQKYKRIKYKKERVVLSDILPFEIPLIFSNRYFYRFLVTNSIEVIDNKVVWNVKGKKISPEEETNLIQIVELLLGCNHNPSAQKDKYIGISKSKRRIPFVYKITHKEKEFRELSVIHPMNQVELVSFYEKYKELILYYCSISRFSIRKPTEIAKYVFFNDKLHKQKSGYKEDRIEVNMHEYEHLKTFFAYKKYTNIFRFYEDYRYQRAEKKYNKLVKFDISKCFDSIYTHSLPWALLNKDSVKDKIELSKNTFAGIFDEFMQNTNYGETNGIVIGPEFSRIFAELILQQVDKVVENMLWGYNPSIRNRVDYECYRYVDDYFLFYNDENVKDEILKLFKLELREYKMWISESKTKYYDKPIITELTMAKLKIVDLLDNSIKFKVEEAEKDEETEVVEDEYVLEEISDKFTIFMNPNKTAAKFKTILKETNVEYKDVLNYTLSMISRKMESIFKKFEVKYKEYTEIAINEKYNEKNLRKKYNLEKRLTSFIINLLDFVFFLYTVYPKVNSTIKLTVILATIINYYKGVYRFNTIKEHRFQRINKDRVFKKIQDEIRLVLEKNKCIEHTQVETLYLLIILKELGEEYDLSETLICNYFNIKQESNNSLNIENHLNMFSITVLLYYISDNSKYDALRAAIKEYVLLKIESIDMNKRRQTSELILLLFDLLTCPSIEAEYKKKLLHLFGVTDNSMQEGILKFQQKQKYWFTKWDKISIGKELNAKICQEVYS